MRRFLVSVLLAVGCFVVPFVAHAATCDDKPGYYVNGSGECVECYNSGYYCPGDGTRQTCPSFSGREVPLWLAEYPDATQELLEFYTETRTASVITRCIARYRITDGRASMSYLQRYNPETDKYDDFFDKWFAWPYAGYYLTSLTSCPLSATWGDVSLCQAGGYCPGETSHWPCANGKSPANFGLYVCGDNTYSDAGASECTPCPAGTGNSGGTLADHAGVASCNKCLAGYYINGAGQCVPCDVGYYCPGDNTRHYCCDTMPNYILSACPLYSDQTGLSACKRCPEVDEKYTDGFVQYWYWIADEDTIESRIHSDRLHCRASWERKTPHGYVQFSCGYYTDGYSAPGSDQHCLVRYGEVKCDAGYYIDRSNPSIKVSNATQFWASSYDDIINICDPVGVGYWSDGKGNERSACAVGSSTHTNTASAATECRPLCTAGATQFHAADLSFNLWPNNECASPALRVGIGGDVCCVNLESGTATGAVHVQYSGATYHTVN